MVRFSQLQGALRLLQSSGRGLTEALPPSLANCAPRNQPWTLSCIQAHSSSSSATASAAAAPAAAPATETPAHSAPAGPSGRIDTPDTAAAAQAAQLQAGGRPAVPPGHIDFTQRQLLMMYTCGQCEVRSAKAFSKAAYTRGVVVVECPGCGARHLIADHLGWFGSTGTVEDFARERGRTVVSKTADGTLELTPEEVVGAAAAAAAGGDPGAGGA